MGTGRSKRPESGIEGLEWLIEKRLNEIDEETGDRLWQIAGEENDNPWKYVPGGENGMINANVNGYCETGDMVRLVVRTENGAGMYSEVRTGGIIIDNTHPPVPLILDQGDVINHTKQELEINWRLSRIDTESGLEAYYWGWFYAGDERNIEWYRLENNSSDELDEFASVDLRNTGINGRTVIFAVKTVNGAGLTSIGYSDGIVLDETAPFIHDVEVYSDSSYRNPCEGYVRAGTVINNTVYVKIRAAENESWMNGGFIQAYIVDEKTAKKEKSGEAVPIREELHGFTARVTLDSDYEGKLWVFEAQIEDGAGNISNRAISSGLMVETGIGGINGLQANFDLVNIHADWDGLPESESRYVRGYSVVITESGKVLASRTVSVPSVSFVWGKDGLGLDNGAIITIRVHALSYAGSEGPVAARTLVIDTSPPEYSENESRIPLITNATHWYDRVEGRAVFTGSGNTGISAIQWSAVLVPGEQEIIGWREKRGVHEISIEELLENVRNEDLEWWHGKGIRFRFRASNGVGIWSGVQTTEAIEIDVSEPETMNLYRDYRWTNEEEAIGGWRIEMSDSESGIIGYQAVVVKDGTEVEKIDWTGIPVNSIIDKSRQPVLLTDIFVPLIEAGEGIYQGIIRVQNGSGRWTACEGDVITIDRTPPELIKNEWPGSFAGKVIIDEYERDAVITNGPTQEYLAESNEDVRWMLIVQGSWLDPLLPAGDTYQTEAEGMILFGQTPEGYVYPVNIRIEDRAGNISEFAVPLRYNRAPQITVRESSLTVTPGKPVFIEDITHVTDDEGSGTGDYPLTFTWDPGNGEQILMWSGGAGSDSVFGSLGTYGTYYIHSGEKVQQSEWVGKLIVTDGYNKTTEVDLPITVTNTKSGSLYMDEYWSGPFELDGIVRIPENITLTLSNSNITAKGLTNKKGLIESGIIAEPGGRLLIANGPDGVSSIAGGVAGFSWLGVEVYGTVSGSGFSVSGAERAFTLHPGGEIQGTEFRLSGNINGMHLLGGRLTLISSIISRNHWYGIKEEYDGVYDIRGIVLDENGVDYYRGDITVLTPEEIQTLIME
ncbi:hypothetical protein K7I13_14975 [Brucepastera parasyntrophica]|uniref:hypothetical protein n=1 Tax=Brucepastera parasyntrophica TaxID=2880008 RepID=UPI00210E4091|nr:hypothetical protein [Brucepastera parasyntrophica]ULQ59734.1 hypothetical protein K7I13_14975 [Brucepastera parasyntrophica]